ncbi:MAG: DUF4325 domain-containing protein [Coxiellaceae bacterium]|nr:DUF4325 domain-containing protein [Coxiellaceae bacterium]
MIGSANKIQKYILSQVDKHPTDIVKKTAEHFSVTRTTVHRHIKHLIDSGQLIKTGTTKQTRYTSSKSLHPHFNASLNPLFDEHDFYSIYCETFIKQYCNDKTENICEYGITEMLNNCKDHSQSKRAEISLHITAHDIIIRVKDNGLGILQTLQETIKINDPRELFFELSKGKLTRDPNNHSGEGIFFTSRIFDKFEVITNDYHYIKINTEDDWSFISCTKTAGTEVILTNNRNSQREIADVFKAYQNEDSLEFVKTDIIIELAKKPNSRLIARSQAKRVCANLDKFKHVTLDFKNVSAVGQGFVDQVFRVYKNQHGNITIDYINANEDVRYMIERGKSMASLQPPKAED